MALRNPPSWLQNGSHPAENDRLTQQAIFSATGVVGSGSMLVSALGTPNLSVNIASGWASILSSTSNAGVYVAYNDAVTNLAATAGDATNPRKDIVVATVADAAYSGSTNTVSYSYVTGTAAASPSAPATPSNSILLATITVPAGATTILSGYIADNRVITASNLVAGLALPLAGGTLTGGLTLAPSTASVAPVKLQSSSTFLTTGSTAAGAIEYDGTVFYSTPNSAGTGGHGVNPSVFYYGLSADRTLSFGAGGTTAQSMFGFALSLAAATTYEVEIVGEASFTTNSTTSCSFSPQLVGGASFTSGDAFAIGGLDGASAITRRFTGSPLAGVIYSATTATTSVVNFVVKATLRTNTATTFNPQVILGANNTTAFSVLRNSYIKVTPVGSSTVTNVGAWA